MFTVVIAQKKHLEKINEYQSFLKPFLRSREVSFCEWNIEGESFAETVPDLPEIVSRRLQWRTVVICDCKGVSATNPFNVVGFKEPDRDDFESEAEYYRNLRREKFRAYDEAIRQPLTRLMTYLCEPPIVTDKGFQTEGELERELEQVPFERGTAEPDSFETAVKSGSLTELEAEKEQLSEIEAFEYSEFMEYKAEALYSKKLRTGIMKNERTGLAFPTEIYCIAPRTGHDDVYELKSIWSEHNVHQYTRFYDWNLYFDRMRYLVFDMMPESNQNHAYDYLRFLNTVLLLADNEVPVGAIHPHVIYRINCENDENELRRLVVSYDEKLLNTRQFLNYRIERIEEMGKTRLTDREARSIFSERVVVPVPSFDNESEREILLADKSDYSFSSDCPQREEPFWDGFYGNSVKTMRKLLKRPERSVARAVEEMHEIDSPSTDQIKKMDRFQLSDIQEQIDSMEKELLEIDIPQLQNADEYEKRLDGRSNTVISEIRTRMSRKEALISGILALALFSIGFVTLIRGNDYSDPRTIPAVAAVFGGSVLLLALVGFLCLVVFRSTLRRKVEGYNSEMNHVISDVARTADLSSKYLSTACNIQRGNSIVNFFNENESEYSLKSRILTKHVTDIDQARAELAEIFGSYLTDVSVADPELTEAYTYNFERPGDFSYPIPFRSGDATEIDYLQKGNRITVPVSFVRNVSLRLEELYD